MNQPIDNQQSITIEDQLSAHADYLDPKLASFIDTTGTLSYVGSLTPRLDDIKSPTAKTIVAEDMLGLLNEATRLRSGNLSKAVSLAEAISVAEDPRKQDTLKNILGSLVLKKTEEVEDFDEEKAKEATEFVLEVFSREGSIDAFKKLFEGAKQKKLTKREKRELLKPVEGGSSQVVTTRIKPGKKIGTMSDSSTREPRAPMNDVIPAEMRAERAEFKEQRALQRGIERYIVDKLKSGNLKEKECIESIADGLGISIEDAATAYSNVIRRSSRIGVVKNDGSKFVAVVAEPSPDADEQQPSIPSSIDATERPKERANFFDTEPQVSAATAIIDYLREALKAKSRHVSTRLLATQLAAKEGHAVSDAERSTINSLVRALERVGVVEISLVGKKKGQRMATSLTPQFLKSLNRFNDDTRSALMSIVNEAKTKTQ